MDTPVPPQAQTPGTPLSREYPDRPWVGVGVVVWRGDKVLLVRRGKPPRAGQWGLPGGAQDVGETLFEAAAREVIEETGLRVRPYAIITAVDAVNRDEDGRVRFHYTLVEVAAEYAGDEEPVAGDDADAAQWTALSEIERLVEWGETLRVIRLSAEQRRQSQPAARRRIRARTDSEKLKPRPDLTALMRSPLGGLIARPWLDTVSLRLLAEWFFPMSRAWAAAMVAGGSFERFCEEVPFAPRRVFRSVWLHHALRETASAVERHNAATLTWERALFHDPSASAAAAVHAEEERLDAATALSTARLSFAMFGRTRRPPACRWDIPSPGEVEERHGARLADPTHAYEMPDRLPEVVVSRHLRSDIGAEYWLRFASPYASIGSPCWARVFEPEDAPSRATVIYLHGICMEADQVRQPLREIEALCRRGIRVIAAEAPWHGRRRAYGRYGGEPLVATAPLGALEHFAAHLRELAVLTAWARRTGSGPVGWSGTSLGAFTCQLAAVHAAGWPERMRADALLLSTTSEGLDEIALSGAIAKAFGVDQMLPRHGWTVPALSRWRPLTDPIGPAAMGGNHVFMLLGSEDTVAPIAGAIGLARRWGVPQDQVFIRPQGHFSIPAGLMVDEAPLAAFAEHLLRL